MRIKKSLIFAFFFIVLSGKSYSQYYDANAAANTTKTPPPKKGWDWNKVYPGGNAGLGIGRNYLYLEASPLAGYWITDWFTSGLSLSFIYFRSSFALYNPITQSTYRTDFNSIVYGVSPFAR